MKINLDRRFFLLGLWIFTLLHLNSCSLERPETANFGININLQEENPQQQFLNSFSLMALTAPSSLGAIQCYAANITGEGIPANNDIGTSCVFNVDPTGNRGFGTVSPPTARGQSVSVDITAGKNRRIDIYGIYPTPPSCGGSSTGNSPEKGGYFLGSQTTDIEEPKAITIPIAYTGATANLTCNDTLPTLPNLSLFGDGSDGDITIIGAVADTSAFTMSNGRKMSASKQLASVDGTGTQLTLNSAITAAEYAAGDEIMWMVMSASGGLGSNCSTSPNELYPGKMGFARLTAVNLGGQTLTTSTPIVAHPGSIINTNLTGGTFCRIQVIRVPNFNNLTLSSGGSFNITVPNYNESFGPGGVLAVRVKGVLTSGSATNAFRATNAGYPGATTLNTQGSSHAGVGSVTNLANGSGGGGGAGVFGGGGGANAGTGGQGSTGGSAGLGGTTNPCNGGASSDCIDMGGGGGNTSGVVGGNGGGIILLYAKSIVVSAGSLIVNADGQNGATGGDGGGGGAAGTVSVKTQSISGALTLEAYGGNGGGGTDGGGGGGGGYAFIDYCSGTAPTLNAPGGVGGPAGVAGATGITVGGTANTSHPFCP